MRSQLERFSGRRAFITGAGSGLGRALCYRLAARGWTIGVQDVREDTARETLAGVEQRGGTGRVFVFDVSRFEAFQQAAKEFLEAFGGVDLVVNNAGVAVAWLAEDVSQADWEWILGINLMGPIHGCRIFLPTLRAQGKGHVVNVASLAGLIAGPTMGPYNVTKFGVVGLSETLRAELVDSGVSVTVVCPSFFQTNIVNAMRSNDPTARSLGTQLVARSGVSAEDVADAVLDAVASDRLYVLPQWDARGLWLLKRLFPAGVPTIFAWGFRKARALQSS